MTVDLATGQGGGTDQIGTISTTDGKGGFTLQVGPYSAFQTLIGSPYDDTLIGDSNDDDLIEGGAGDDILVAGAGNVTFIGGTGADTLIGGTASADGQTGGGGIATADYSDGDGVTVNLTTGTGSRSTADGDLLYGVSNLIGSPGADVLTGDTKSNIIDPGLSGGGIDVVDGGGGLGADTLVLDYSQGDYGQGVVGGFGYNPDPPYSLADPDVDGTFQRMNTAETAVLDGVDFSDISKLDVTGTIQDDTVYGGRGGDTIRTGGGNDTIYEEGGSATVDAGDGDDTVYYGTNDFHNLVQQNDQQDYSGPFALDGGAGIDTLSISFADDLSAQNANITLKGQAPDTEFDGTNLVLPDGSAITNFEIVKDVVTDNGDDYVVQPGDVDNTISTGFGQDTIAPGLGIDKIDGGFDFTVGKEISGPLTDPKTGGTYYTVLDQTAFLENSGDTLDLDYSSYTGAGGVVGTTNAVQSTIDVRLANNQYANGEKLPFDTNDGQYTAGSNTDSFSEIERLVVVGSSQNDVLVGTVDGFIDLPASLDYDSLNAARGDDVLDGGAGDDVLIGLSGSDTLDGGAGNDLLIGGAIDFRDGFQANEIDTLTGGSGADTFVLGTADGTFYDSTRNAPNVPLATTATRAIITDFTPADGDTIELYDKASDYVAVQSGTDTLIYDTNGSTNTQNDGLIAQVQNFTGFDLNASYVTYDAPAEGAALDVNGNPVSQATLDLRNAATGTAVAPLPTTQASTASTDDKAHADVLSAPDAGAPAQNAAPAFTVTQDADPQDLEAALVPDAAAAGIDPSSQSIQLSGNAAAFGTFSDDPFGLGSGIVLSTGKVTDIVGPNTYSDTTAAPVSKTLDFVNIGTVKTASGDNDVVYRADLSGFGTSLGSLTLTDGNTGATDQGGGGVASGFDLDGVALSGTLLSDVSGETADVLNDLTTINAFDFSAADLQFAPGTQKPASGGYSVGPDLLGSRNGLVDNAVATLQTFDGADFTGALSLGDGGSLGLNLTQPVSTTSPLYLYIAEDAGGGSGIGETIDGTVDASSAPLPTSGPLSTDFGDPGPAGDTTSLTYTFKTAPGTAADTAFFTFALFTQELPTLAGAAANDQFKITLNGVNLALLSDGSAATINNLESSPDGAASSDLVLNTDPDAPAHDITAVNAYTTPLTFAGALNPNGETNTLVVQVADVGNGLLDSGILIKSGTFQAGAGPGGVTIGRITSPLVVGGPATMVQVTLDPGPVAPTGPVTIVLTPDDDTLDFGSGAGKPTTITFTPGGSYTAELSISAAVTGVPESGETSACDVAVTSTDPRFNATPVAPIVVQIASDAAPVTVYHWATATSGDFAVATNWNPVGVPMSADAAAIDATGSSYTVAVSDAESIASLTTVAAATLAIGDNTASQAAGQLTIGGAIVNAGIIALNAAGDTTALILGSPTDRSVKLTGGGKIILSDSAKNVIATSATSAATTLDNVDNTISGAGTIDGGNGFSLTNESGGTIDATGTSNGLVIGTPLLTNAGLIEDTGLAGLQISTDTIANTGGTISAVGTGAHVDLENTSLRGGTLATSGGGVIDVIGVVTLEDSTSADAITIAGAIAGPGTLSLEDGTSTFATGAALSTAGLSIDTGATAVISGTLSYAGSLTNAGTTSLASGAALDLSGSLSGSGGHFDLAGDATLELDQAAEDSQTVALVGAGNDVVLGAPAAFQAPITGFAAGDILDLKGETVVAVSYSGSTLTATLSNSTTQTFDLAGSVTAFEARSDGTGGSLIEAAHSPLTEVVDSLTIAGDDIITPEDQLAGPTVPVTGTLSATLAPGDQVVVTLAGQTYDATIGANGTSFFANVATPDIFGAVQAYVQDAYGTQNATYTQDFELDPGKTNSLPENPDYFGYYNVISADGTHVAFETQAINLAPGTSGVSLFDENLLTGAVTLIVTGLDTTEANNFYVPSIDADGKEVAYEDNGEVYVYTAGQGSTDIGTYGTVGPLQLSADGTELLYTELTISQIVTAANGNSYFVREPDTGQAKSGVYTNYASPSAEGQILASYTNGSWNRVLVSPDGQTATVAPNGQLVAPAPASPFPSVFDQFSSTLYGFDGEFLTASTDGAFAETAAGFEVGFDGPSATNYRQQVSYVEDPTGRVVVLANDGVLDTTLEGLSADGTIALFSTGGNVGFGTFDYQQIYEENLTTGAVTLVSSGPNGPANNSNFNASLSSDGRYVTFGSDASNLDDNNTLFVKDVQTGALQPIGYGSVAAPGAISADGRFVSFIGIGDEIADLQAPLIDFTSKDMNTLEASDIPSGTYLYVKDGDDFAAAQAGGDSFFQGRTNTADGSLVTVTFDGHTYTGTTKGGAWTVDEPAADVLALTAGTEVATATVTDSQGRQASASVTYTIDPAPIAEAIITGLDPASDSGSSNTDNLTNVTDPTIVGTALPYSLVAVGDISNGSVFQAPDDGIGYADASGNFAIQIQGPLSDGVHVLEAVESVVDGMGRLETLSPSDATLTVTIETQAPSLGTSTPDPAAPAIAASLTYAVDLTTTETFDAADFALTGTGSATGTITGVTGSGTTYAVTVSGVSGVGTLTLGLVAADQLTDAAGNVETLTSTAHTVAVPISAPNLDSIYPAADTNSTSVEVSGTGTYDGDTITLYDGTVEVGQTVVQYGYYGIELDNLNEGTHALTAVESGSEGADSAPSAPLNVTVDLTPPSETVATISIGEADLVTLADQQNGTVTVTGTLSAPLAAGDSIVIVPSDSDEDGQPFATPSADGLSFTAQITAPGLAGTVSAYVQDGAGNESATLTQAYTAEIARVVTLISATPNDPSASMGLDPSLSADGSRIAFQSYVEGADGYPVSTVYLEDTATGALTTVATGASDPVLSADGHSLAFLVNDPTTFAREIEVQDLTNLALKPVLVTTDGAGAPDAFDSADASLSGDGTTLVFDSASPDLGGGATDGSTDKIFIATFAGGAVASLKLLAGDDTGSSLSPKISQDGSTVAFDSAATDLVPGVTSGTSEIYAETIATATTTLVSAAADGTPADASSSTPSLSANGRYAVFESLADNLAPDNLGAGQTLPAGVDEVYWKDLQTGEVKLVSETAAGVPAGGDNGADNAIISDDGQSVAFLAPASSFGGTSYSTQVYLKSLATGALTLLSSPGEVPGDGYDTQDVTLSNDGSKVAFDSTSNNLVGDLGSGDGYYQAQVFLVTPLPLDAAAPSVSVPQPITVAATSAAGAVVSFTASATDPVDGTDPVTFSQASGSVFPIGTTTVLAEATDAAGNIGTASFAVTVADTTVPTVTASATTAIVQATSAAGGVETFTGSATDPVDGTDPVVYTEQLANGGTQIVHSGDTFAIGTHTIVASATDKAGNIGVTAPFSFSVAAPVAMVAVSTPTIDAPPALTDNRTPTLTGTGQAGSTITLTATTSVLQPNLTKNPKTTALGSTIVNADGTWSFVVGSNGTPVLANQRTGFGEVTNYTFSATATETGSTPSATVTSATLDLDTTAPALTLTTASSTDAAPATIDGAIVVNTLNPVGDNDAGLTVTVTDADTLGATTTTTTTTTKAGIGGSFSVPFSQTLGTHVVTASATDAAGNVGASAPVTIAVTQVVHPTLTIDTLPLLIVNPAQPISGTIDLPYAGDVISVYDGVHLIGTTIANAATGIWQLVPNWAQTETASLTATVTDGNGTVTTAAVSAYVIPFGPADEASAQSLASAIDAADPSKTQIITANGMSTVDASKTYVIDLATGANTLAVNANQSVIAGSGGTSVLVAEQTNLGFGQTIAFAGGTTSSNTVLFKEIPNYLPNYGADLIGPAAVALAGMGTVVASGGENVFDSGSTDTPNVFLTGSQNNFVAGAGTATVVDQGSNDTINGSSGSLSVLARSATNLNIVGGAGTTLVVASETGTTNTIYGFGATIRFFGGSGNASINTINSKTTEYFIAGSGNDVFTGGSGTNVYVFFSGSGSGNIELTNFNPAKDYFLFDGFGVNFAKNNAEIGTTKYANGVPYYSFTLPDNTKVTLDGLSAFPSYDTVEDGYIVGGTVGYLNAALAQTGVVGIDSAQPTTTTNAVGDFTLTGGTGPYVLTGGTDSSTGLAFTGTLTAPNGATIVSPLTTLIEAAAEASGDTSVAGIAAANALVSAALGLPTGTDLTTLDAEAGTLEGDPTATKAYEAGTVITAFVSLATAAGVTAQGLEAALVVAARQGPIDLTDAAQVAAIATSAGLPATAAAAIGAIVSANTMAVAGQIATSPTPNDVFVAITGASLAAQTSGTAAITAAQASSDPNAFASAAAAYAQSLPATLATSDATATGLLASQQITPTIAGTQTGQATTDGASAAPFAGVTIADPAGDVTATISVTAGGVASDADGTFAPAAGLTVTGVGSYTLQRDTPAAVQAALQALVFVPTAHQVTSGASVTTGFTITLTDDEGLTTSDSATSLAATALPVVTLSSNGGAISIVDPTVSGTVDLADASGTVRIYENGTAVGAPVVVSAQGTFSTALSLPSDGTYVVTAEKPNASGGVGTSNAVTFTLNSSPNESLFGAPTNDVTSAGGKIYALYETILGRAPDPLGDDGWVAALGSGTPLTTIAQDFLASLEYASDYGSSVQSNDAFINQLYQDGLHRQADPSGLKTWENALATGTSRAQVAIDIATSQESQQDLGATFQAGVFVPDATDSAVARLYYGVLGRAPDAGGLRTFETAVHSGGLSLTQAAQSFLGSSEYQGTAVGQSNLRYIEGLYQTALGRTGDAGGVQTYETALDTGTATRATVADAFLGSSEFQTDEAGQANSAYVNTVYQAALGRQADPNGLQTWDALLAGGTSRVTVAQDIVGSAEFAANVTAPAQATFVNALYEGALGRPADAGGLQANQNAIAGGASLASIVLGITQSPEAVGHLAPAIETGFHVA